jgi:hypothetical protein
MRGGQIFCGQDNGFKSNAPAVWTRKIRTFLLATCEASRQLILQRTRTCVNGAP